MLKLNASYSKKVPAEGEYSSQSYHASIECELPDGLNANQLQERIHDTFELVRQSVEAELHDGNRQQQQPTQMQQTQQTQQLVSKCIVLTIGDCKFVSDQQQHTLETVPHCFHEFCTPQHSTKAVVEIEVVATIETAFARIIGSCDNALRCVIQCGIHLGDVGSTGRKPKLVALHPFKPVVFGCDC